MFQDENSVHSSKVMNEFNREEDSLPYLSPQNRLQSVTTWFIFLCPLIFLIIIFAISISVLALVSTIDGNLLDKTAVFINSATTTPTSSNSICQQIYESFQLTTDFVLFNFISFKGISSINLLLSIVGLIFSTGYIFLYYKLQIRKKNVFSSKTIPPFLVILNGFVIFFCILQSFLYWINEANIDADVLGTSIQGMTECFGNQALTPENVSIINTYLETETTSLNGLVVFLFVWSLTFLCFWSACYAIKRFRLKEDIFRRPI